MGTAPRNQTIRFVLGGRTREIAGLDPNTTVLDWLREHEGRRGTKEGCAEGDCGACTVVLGELASGRNGGRIRYRAVNACIMFVPVLDGKELVTVEDLQAPDGALGGALGGALHPAQQALVDCHGAQCGFCTPGFVMSLFALYKSGDDPSRDRINDAIAGNLCRCTGYRPIVEAAEKMYDVPDNGRFDTADKATVKLLRALRRKQTLAFAHGGKRYFAPVDLAGLAALVKKHPDACLLAGGTDVGLWVTKQHRDLDTVIYLGQVEELHRVRTSESHLEIGAGATYTEAFAALAGRWPDLGEIVRRLGCEQIRNVGTLGGNIANASPIGDSMPALIALGATVVLRRGAKRRELALDEFFLGYRKTALAAGEFIERIRVPLPRPGRRFHAYKIAKRFDQDISAVCGAYALELDGGRVRDISIAYGGMAATPKRAAHCEAALRGGAWTSAAVAAAGAALAKDFQPIGDLRAGAEYRMTVAKNLLHKVYLETAAAGNGGLQLGRWGRGP